MQLKINLYFLICIFLITSCTLNNNNIVKVSKNLKKNIIVSKEPKDEEILYINDNPLYILEEPYFIEGIKYIPEENYSYSEIGLASFYGRELHRVKTINNEFNNVTELLGRHKTLPIPSVVKVTNLDNGLSLIIRINDRGPNDNSKIIQVSRKVAQLLRFYKSKIAKVKLEILSDPSKQLKIVTLSMNDPDFNNTIEAAPTQSVTISDIGESSNDENLSDTNYEQPIELIYEEISQSELFVKILGFNSYDEAKKVKNITNDLFKITTQKENNQYIVLLGPMNNNEANNLFQNLLSKGYKEIEIVLK